MRQREARFASLALLCWAFPLALRALPHTPGHDGVRQILPAFGSLALLAGLGVGARPPLRSRCLVIAALVEGAISIAVMMPVPLSYFSPAVGGLPGAALLGFEPTYYWDTLTPDVLAWVNEQTKPGRSIAFLGAPTSYYFLKRSGQLRPVAVPFDERFPWQWYLVQNRPGAMDAVDRVLIARYGHRRRLLVKLGVPLVWAFDRGEMEEIEREKGSISPERARAGLGAMNRHVIQ